MKMRTISQYYRPFRPVVPFFIKNIELKNTPNLDEILREPKLLWVANHGPALGPFGLALGICKLFCENGAGHRIPRAITAKEYYKVPLVKHLFTLITQVDRPMSLDDYVADFNQKIMTDLLVMPEGEYSQFGDGLRLQPFRSHRFIELAVKAQVPILLIAHRGTHQWGKLRTFNHSLLHWIEKKGHALFGTPFVRESLAEFNRIQIMQFPKTLESFEMSLKLHRFSFTWDDLEKDSQMTKKRMIEASESLQKTLQDMLNALDD